MSLDRPHFTAADLPLSDEQLRQRETWMMETGNWRGDHSVPSVGEHYRYMWKWDSYKGIVINARRGDPDRAQTEFFALERYRDPATGFLPNKIFATAPGKTWRDYPEAWNSNDNTVGTSYSQPPIAAWAAMETYQSFVHSNRHEDGLRFLHRAYGTATAGRYAGLAGEYAYFMNHRQNSPDDPLIGIVHPNETGRDSDEANKPWLVGKGKYHPVAEWMYMQKFGWDVGRLGRDAHKRRIDWIPEQVRQKYWVNDVMFNAMYVSNLQYMADIASTLALHSRSQEAHEEYESDTVMYWGIADTVEGEMLNRMWDGEQGYFYNLDNLSNQIKIDSATGLFALMLEDLTENQFDALLHKLESPEWFATPYPIPTHAVRSPFYDPNPEGLKNKLTPQWSGTVWTDVNHFIVEEGLVSRLEQFPDYSSRIVGRAAIIAMQTKALLAGEVKSMEYYSPETGKGMRVADFMWSNIGLHFEKFEQATR